MDQILISNIERFNKLLATTKGRDRWTKLLQSASKIYGQHLENQISIMTDATLKSDTSLILAKCTAFDGALTGARKVFRLFTFLGGFVALLNFLKVKELTIDHYLDITSKLGVSSYQFLDGLNWAAKVKLLSSSPDSLLSNSKEEQIGILSNQFWLIGIIANLIQTIKQISTVTDQAKRKTLILQAIGLSCDALCAIHGSKFKTLSKGTFGAISVISALLGIYEMY